MRAEFSAFLGSIDDDVFEVRVAVGPDKDNTSVQGRVRVGKKAPSKVADEVFDLAEGCEVGPAVRVYLHDEKGSRITSRYYGPKGSRTGRTGMSKLLESPVVSTEDALWRMSTILVEIIDRLSTSNETVLHNAGQPMAALGDLFRSESEARQRAEERWAKLFPEHVELQVLAQQAADVLDNPPDGDDGGIRQAAAAFLWQLMGKNPDGSDKPNGDGGTSGPAESTDGDGV